LALKHTHKKNAKLQTLLLLSSPTLAKSLYSSISHGAHLLGLTCTLVVDPEKGVEGVGQILVAFVDCLKVNGRMSEGFLGKEIGLVMVEDWRILRGNVEWFVKMKEADVQFVNWVEMEEDGVEQFEVVGEVLGWDQGVGVLVSGEKDLFIEYDERDEIIPHFCDVMAGLIWDSVIVVVENRKR